MARLREGAQQAQIKAQLESQQLVADSFMSNAKVVSESIDTGFEKSMSQLVQLYKHDHKAEGEHLKQSQEMQKQLMMPLVSAVEQLAQQMAEGLSQSLTQSLLKSDEMQTSAHDIPDVTTQLALMADALKQALEPLTLRMDEKLAIDSSTDQSGKLIVNSLNRLNKILDDYE